MGQSTKHLIEAINDASEPLSDGPHQYSALLDSIGDARFILIGEASHGTHEFYKTRAEISRELIEKKGFMAITIEGDWPDAYRIHRYIQGLGDKKDSKQALNDFTRFPTWMWRNTVLPPFLAWLREYNDLLSPASKIGFYGLDLYSLETSMKAVINYLSKVDPEAADRARKRYACFDDLSHDPHDYGYLTSVGRKKSCIKEVVDELIELQHNAAEYMRRDGISAEDEHFYAVQNARLVKDAETYYRSMFESHEASWNVRDTHMANTLNNLSDHLEKRFNRPAKIIVWAHNSHIGDARATEMNERQEVNLGQLVREQHDNDSFLIGFSTYDGFVTAASDWGVPANKVAVNPALAGSYEDLFHQAKYKNFILDLSNKPLEHYLKIPRLQRAIGVVYKPETERYSHYFFTRLPYQFDKIIHIDRTSAVQPL